MDKPSFAAVFFRLYDRKIASGEITFSQTGIKKNDFTKICVEPGYVFDAETIDRICRTMHLTQEEERDLRDAADPQTPGEADSMEAENFSEEMGGSKK